MVRSMEAQRPREEQWGLGGSEDGANSLDKKSMGQNSFDKNSFDQNRDSNIRVFQTDDKFNLLIKNSRSAERLQNAPMKIKSLFPNDSRLQQHNYSLDQSSMFSNGSKKSIGPDFNQKRRNFAQELKQGIVGANRKIKRINVDPHVSQTVLDTVKQ